MNKNPAISNLDSFTISYLECALWSSCDGDGNPLDREYYITNFSKETLEEMITDCKSFQEENKELLCEIDDKQAGYDFWLTRNHHGSGFWCRGLTKTGELLTKASEAMGEVNLYVGDDGEIYCDRLRKNVTPQKDETEYYCPNCYCHCDVWMETGNGCKETLLNEVK